MGFGYEALRKDHPASSMSRCRIQAGQALRQTRVYDPVVQAISGFMNADSQSRREDGRAAPHQTIACDKVTAITAAQAITAAALFARARGAGGQHVTLTMIEATLAFLWPDAFYNHAPLDSEAPPSPDFASFYGIMATKDGFVTTITISDDEFRDCRASGGGYRRRSASRTSSRAWPTPPRSKAAFAEAVATFTTADVRARLEAEDAPHAVVLTGPKSRRTRRSSTTEVRSSPTIRPPDGCARRFRRRNSPRPLVAAPPRAPCSANRPTRSSRTRPLAGRNRRAARRRQLAG